MDHLLTFSYWMAGAVVVYWVVSYGLTVFTLKTRIILTEDSYPLIDPSKDHPKISVVVAAKDEEQHIETCLRTMLDQSYPDFEVIVVDDRSTDETPNILQRLKEEYGDKLTVIHNTKLKEGWVGKSNAMREGIEASSGDWICMTDADCRQTSHQTLSITLQEALTNQVDFLSVTPVLDMDETWGLVVQPACVLTLMAWHHPGLVNNSRSQVAYANGPFMLISRKCYEAIDGHERVKGEMNEDILLAVHSQKEGYRIRTADNDGLFHARMYEGIGEAWKGWSRIFCGCLQSTGKLLLTIVTVLLHAVLPWVMLAVSVTGLMIDGQPIWKELTLLWGGACLMMLLFSYMYYSCYAMNRAWSLLFPVGGAVLLGMLINSLLIYWGFTKASYGGQSYQMVQGGQGKIAD